MAGWWSRARKQLLPTYDVFDETRYFEPGSESVVAAFKGINIGLTVCEDIWYEDRLYPVNPVAGMLDLQADSVDCLVNISASPYYHGKIGERNSIFSSLCRKYSLPLLYVNQVGGQDSLVFDGHSMVINKEGKIGGTAPGFTEDMLIIDSDTWRSKQEPFTHEDSIENVLDALTLGVRDYLAKTGFSTAVLGLSGGIDSAVTAAVASLALGPENVLTVALPSPYTSQASIDDARQLAENLGCQFTTIPIQPAMDAYRQSLSPLFEGLRRRCDRTEHPGPHPRKSADGPVQQVRQSAPFNRQQIGNGSWLLHSLR